MSQLSITQFPSTRSAASGSAWAHLTDALRVMFRTWKTRRLLTTLTARELADIGVSKTAAEFEANRMPWDLAQPKRF